MKLTVDKQKCQGHAMCAAVAPSVYPLDDEGYVAFEHAEVDESDRSAATLGIETCPEQAISATT